MNKKTDVIIRTIYALCLTSAGFNHLTSVIDHGLFWDHHNAPLFTCIFWTLLTFLKPKIGLILTVLIITSDVIHNTWYDLIDSYSLLNPSYIAQFGFMVFVLLTIKYPWQVWSNQHTFKATQ